VAPMLAAKSSTSRFSQVTACGGYSCPAPGADMLAIDSQDKYSFYYSTECVRSQWWKELLVLLDNAGIWVFTLNLGTGESTVEPRHLMRCATD
jgi:hypothetical protein